MQKRKFKQKTKKLQKQQKKINKKNQNKMKTRKIFSKAANLSPR